LKNKRRKKQNLKEKESPLKNPRKKK